MMSYAFALRRLFVFVVEESTYNATIIIVPAFVTVLEHKLGLPRPACPGGGGGAPLRYHKAVVSRIKLALQATHRIPHGASRSVLAVSAWSVKTRRAPSRHCRDARVYGRTTTAMQDIEYTSRPSNVTSRKVNRSRRSSHKY